MWNVNLLHCEKDQKTKKKILNTIKTGKAASKSKAVVVQNDPESSRADMEGPGSLRYLSTGPQGGMGASVTALYDGVVGCFVGCVPAVQSLQDSKRAQPHPLGLTRVLAPTDRLYHQAQLRIAFSWPAQRMEAEVDGVLWGTCRAGPGTLISSAEDGDTARAGWQTARAVE